VYVILICLNISYLLVYCFNVFLFLYRWYKSIFKLLGDFYEQMTNPMYSAVADVYAFMFICDLITFLITVFGYASFGPSVSSFALPDVYRKCIHYV